MSNTHYLIDLYTADASITTSRINAIRSPSNGESPLGGNFCVRIPSDVSVQNPTNLGDLLTKKHAGILANHTGFATHIVSDDMIDDAGVDKTATGAKGTYGKRGSNSINAGAKLQSLSTALGSTPTSAIVVWELFDYLYADSATAPLVRTYKELDVTTTTVAVSFNAGSSFTTVTNGTLLNIGGGDQGPNFVIRFTNISGGRVWVGSWSVLF